MFLPQIKCKSVVVKKRIQHPECDSLQPDNRSLEIAFGLRTYFQFESWCLIHKVIWWLTNLVAMQYASHFYTGRYGKKLWNSVKVIKKFSLRKSTILISILGDFNFFWKFLSRWPFEDWENTKMWQYSLATRPVQLKESHLRNFKCNKYRWRIILWKNSSNKFATVL